MHWILYLNILFSLLELSHPSSPDYVFGIQSIHFSPGLPRWLESERHSVVSDSLQPHGLIRSVEFSRLEYWSGYPFPPPGDLSNPGIKPRSPSLQADSLPAEPSEKLKNTGAGSLSLLQWIFPSQELNQGLLHCRQILYQLSYQRSPGG